MSLLTGLENYWELDEASGNRLDDVGGITLTDVNTVGSTSGLGGLVADFVTASNEYLSSAVFPFVGTPGTMSFWFRLPSTATSSTYYELFAIGDDNNSSASIIFRVYKSDNTQGYVVGVIKDSTSAKANSSDWTATNAWHHILITHTSTSSSWYLNGTNANPAWGTNPLAVDGDMFSTATTEFLRIGKAVYGNETNTGQIAKVGIWSRVLDSTDIADLYNGGSPPSYPFGGGVARNPVPMGFVLE